MMESGFVKLYRSLLSWEWYDDINTKTVFLHLLLTVSIEDSKWHGITVKRGSRVSSFSTLSKEVKLSERQVRTAISHLESTGEVTRYKYPKFTVFSVNNFDKWQSVTGSPTEYRQGNDKVAAVYRQQYKKVKESKEDNNTILTSTTENFSTVSTIPTFEEVETYIQEIGGGVDPQKFFDTYSARNWKTKKGKPLDWKCAVTYWQNTEGKFKSKPKSKSESVPESPMAEAYKSLVYNIDE